MDYETRCRRLADQVAAGREVRWDQAVDALRGAADEIAVLRRKVERLTELERLALTTAKAGAALLVVYVATELAVMAFG